MRNFLSRGPEWAALLLATMAGAFFGFFWTDARRPWIVLVCALVLGAGAVFALLLARETAPAEEAAEREAAPAHAAAPAPPVVAVAASAEAAPEEPGKILQPWLAALAALTGASGARLLQAGTGSLRLLAGTGGKGANQDAVHPLPPGPLTFVLETLKPYAAAEPGETRLGYVAKLASPYAILPFAWRGGSYLLVLERAAPFAADELPPLMKQEALFKALMDGHAARRAAARSDGLLALALGASAKLGEAANLIEWVAALESLLGRQWGGVRARLAISEGPLVEKDGEKTWDGAAPGWAKWSLDNLEQPFTHRQPTSTLPFVAADLQDATGPFRLGILVPLDLGATKAALGLHFADAPPPEADELIRHLLPQLQDGAARLHALTAAARAAETDPLTGLLNRRGFSAGYERLARRGPLALLAIDLDHFKAVNDTHGHAAGDEVLKRVAALILETMRAGDLGGRLGGEELAVVLPGADSPGARRVAERLREGLASEEFMAASGTTFQVTMSVGLVARTGPRPPLATLIEEADGALYKAKHEGRNRVIEAG